MTRRQWLRIGLTVLAAITLAACGITGSGDMVTEERDVGSFDRIDVSGGIDVTLVVDASRDPSVTVTYDDNLIDDLTTRVSGDTLVIEHARSVTLIGGIGSGRLVEVVTNSIEDIDVSGGSDLTASGSTDSYRLTASGGSDTDLRGLEARDVDLDVSGGSDAQVFASESVEGEASGGSDVTVYGDPQRVLVDTSGGSDVDLR